MKKTVVRRPAKRRSQTHSTYRRKSVNHSYVAALRGAKLPMPQVSAQRTGVMAIVLVLIVALISLLLMPNYRISTINVTGNEGTATQDIEDAAGPAIGRSSFLLRTADIKDSVMGVSGVERADVRITLPGKLDVTVKDARPEVAWLSGGQLHWVDKNAIVCEPPAVDPERRILIRDLTSRILQKGDKVDASALKSALKLSVHLQKDISGFEYQREGDLIAVGNPGWRAVFDTHGDLTAQVAAFRNAMSSGRSMTYVDVRVPDMVVYR